ncbi:MAG: hypothetical protein J5803_03555 [Desulfovibrio sp.]|nr:hypothetical protein [Desulfovibrio sp.]
MREEGIGEPALKGDILYTGTERKGRLFIRLLLLSQGHDIVCLLTGGMPHIGAVAVQFTGEEGKSIVKAGHREGDISLSAARALSNAFDCTVTVLCGIHFDAISKNEIDDVLFLASNLVNDAIQSVSFDRKSSGHIIT